MMIATAGLVVYILGFWMLVITVLRHLKRHRSFGDKMPLLLFGWMYDKFQAQWYWYDVISLLQRTIYVSCMRHFLLSCRGHAFQE